MTDTELEQLTANLRTKSVADIGELASDAFVGHGMRDDGDSMVVLHAIVVQLLGELAALRALREACEALGIAVRVNDPDDDELRWCMTGGSAEMAAVSKALAECEKASAPQGE